MKATYRDGRLVCRRLPPTQPIEAKLLRDVGQSHASFYVAAPPRPPRSVRARVCVLASTCFVRGAHCPRSSLTIISPASLYGLSHGAVSSAYLQFPSLHGTSQAPGASSCRLTRYFLHFTTYPLSRALLALSLHTNRDAHHTVPPESVLPGGCTMAALQSYQLPAVQEFLSRIEDASEQCRVETKGALEITHSFVPASEVQALVDSTSVANLLKNFFDPRDSQSQDLAKAISRKCPRSLYILVALHKLEWIHHFVEHPGLWDDKQPFDKEPRDFPRTPEDPTFFNRFCQHQPRFYPNRFERLSRVSIDGERLLPIVHKKWIAGGFSAKLHHVVVHREYDDLHGDNEVCNVRYPLMESGLTFRHHTITLSTL